MVTEVTGLHTVKTSRRLDYPSFENTHGSYDSYTIEFAALSYLEHYSSSKVNRGFWQILFLTTQKTTR